MEECGEGEFDRLAGASDHQVDGGGTLGGELGVESGRQGPGLVEPEVRLVKLL